MFLPPEQAEGGSAPASRAAQVYDVERMASSLSGLGEPVFLGDAPRAAERKQKNK